MLLPRFHTLPQHTMVYHIGVGVASTPTADRKPRATVTAVSNIVSTRAPYVVHYFAKLW